MERRHPMLGLAIAITTMLAARGIAAQPPDTTRAPRPTARADATRRAVAEPRATARDRVRADDPTCDDLCRRERMMDSLYGRDRERLPRTEAARPPARARTRATPTPTPTPARPTP